MRECVEVKVSVFNLLRPRGDSLTVNGGIFSLFPLRSISTRDVRGRFAQGPESIVDASSSSSRRSTETDLMLAVEGEASSCDRCVRFPRTEVLEERRWTIEEDIWREYKPTAP